MSQEIIDFMHPKSRIGSQNMAHLFNDVIETVPERIDALSSEFIDRETADDQSEPEFQQNGTRTHRPLPMMVDWRREVCNFLDMSDTCTDHDIRVQLESASERLSEYESLKRLAFAKQGPPRVQVINQVECQRNKAERGLYLDTPWVVESGPQQAHLRCSRLIDNLELHLERNKEITCIIYRDYSCCGHSPLTRNSDHPEAIHGVVASSLRVSEHVSIVSDELRMAWKTLIANDVDATEDITHPEKKKHDDQDTRHPYLWWFHHRQDVKLWSSVLDRESQKQIRVFQSYLEESLGDEWAKVDELLSSAKVTTQYLDYVFAPRQVLISRLEGPTVAQSKAYTTTSWPRSRSVEVSHWKFDGNFQRFFGSIEISPPSSTTGEYSINSMSVYPMQYATEDVVLALRERGKTFWKCRRRNYVCVLGTSDDHLYDANSGSRFMIDTATYKQMHPPANNQPPPLPYHDELGPELMSQDDPPTYLGDDFIMCLPTSLNGFNMQKKEWVKLEVAYFREVAWNEEAFNLLVMEPKTKELVEAVVTNHVDDDRNTDVIHGKGNGLFILLHGGPGTGKTLTAESVAEITKKPLYRVTCGDIGTKAEEVERYLEVVLLLGKTWGCVVLLDEADVFLEQRKLDNLDRNALVSVFLRVLEYYDGILILTSNRVGIFDEAFKSRIQLNLRYENLGEPQRRQIWENFINRLERLESERLRQVENQTLTGVIGGPHSAPRFGVDITSIRQQIDELAKPALNGREIRNTISTARQLATFRKEKLAYEHLEACIAESHKFERYIKSLKRGFSADQIKSDQQER